MKTVLVTGASRGIGLAISQRLVASGYRVIGISRTAGPEFAKLKHAYCVAHDLSDLHGISDLVRAIVEEHGPPYGLVNNAGLGMGGILATIHAKDIAKTLRVNLEAPITLTKYVCRSMLQQREGRIINITSIIANTGFNGLSVYAASKAGLEGFTRSLSRELGKVGICANCVAPGFIETEMTQDLDANMLDGIRRRSPLGLANTAEVAGAVAYLLSPEARTITGTTITVDGGSSA